MPLFGFLKVIHSKYRAIYFEKNYLLLRSTRNIPECQTELFNFYNKYYPYYPPTYPYPHPKHYPYYHPTYPYPHPQYCPNSLSWSLSICLSAKVPIPSPLHPPTPGRPAPPPPRLPPETAPLLHRHRVPTLFSRSSPPFLRIQAAHPPTFHLVRCGSSCRISLQVYCSRRSVGLRVHYLSSFRTQYP